MKHRFGLLKRRQEVNMPLTKIKLVCWVCAAFCLLPVTIALEKVENSTIVISFCFMRFIWNDCNFFVYLFFIWLLLLLLLLLLLIFYRLFLAFPTQANFIYVMALAEMVSMCFVASALAFTYQAFNKINFFYFLSLLLRWCNQSHIIVTIYSSSVKVLTTLHLIHRLLHIQCELDQFSFSIQWSLISKMCISISVHFYQHANKMF